MGKDLWRLRQIEWAAREETRARVVTGTEVQAKGAVSAVTVLGHGEVSIPEQDFEWLIDRLREAWKDG